MNQKRKFKQTEIGKIPDDWEVKSIDKVAEVVGGGTPSTKNVEYWDGDIAWITPKDLSNFKFRYITKGERNITKKGLENSSAKLVPKGTVLLTTRAPVGYVAIAENIVSTNQGFRSLIPKDNVKLEFLFYLLKKNVEILKSNAGGTTFGELSGSRLKALQFAFPDIGEQTAIAKILSDLDSRIELNQQMNTTLEKIGQALFKHWFVDFEFPDEKGKPYKSSGGEMVYIEDIGQELPKGWKKGLVSDLVNHSKDTISPYDSSDKIFFHYSIPSYDEGKWPSMEKGNLIKSNKFLVKSNSILVSKLNPRMPRIWAVGEVDESCSVCSTEFQVLVPQKKWNYNYVYFSFNSGEITDEMKSLVTGTSSSHQRVRPEDMLNLKIVIPAEGVLLKFEDISFCLRQKMWQMDIENKHLCSIRDSLLPRLMSGKIRVGMAK